MLNGTVVKGVKKMVDICLWRGRIGCFHLARVAAALKRGKKQAPGDGRTDVTLVDILIFCIVLLSLVKLGFCAYYNVQAAGSCPFLPTLESTMMRQTLSSWEESRHDVSVLETKLFLQVPMVVTLCVGNLAWSIRKILLSNDVESNPGPEHVDHTPDTAANVDKQGEVKVGESGSVGSADILTAIQKQGQLFQAQLKELKEHSDEQTKRITEGQKEIKDDLRRVSEECERINQRCNQIEEKNKDLAEKVWENRSEVKVLQAESEKREEENRMLGGRVKDLTEDIERMNSEIDRLEEFSRRDNLRMFGVPSVSASDKETYDDCSAAVCNVLNSVDRTREWSDKDIVRAHRVGQPRRGEPKPMIVKFSQWRDKMMCLTDKTFRGKLEREGVRVANDLTKRQMDIVSEAKREGKAAYFVKGKMTIGPKRPDHRSHAEVSSNGVFVDTAPSTPVNQWALPPTSLSHPPTQSASGALHDVTAVAGNSLSVNTCGNQGEAGAGVSQPRGACQLHVTGPNKDGQRSTVGPRSRSSAPVTGAGKQQPGISSYMKGQHGSGNRTTPTGGMSQSNSRTLRSSANTTK